jgi:hypothetical protein
MSLHVVASMAVKKWRSFSRPNPFSGGADGSFVPCSSERLDVSGSEI